MNRSEMDAHRASLFAHWRRARLAAGAISAVLILAGALPGLAQDVSVGTSRDAGGPGALAPVHDPLAIALPRKPVYYAWMDPQVKSAWQGQYYGQGVTITIIDDFTSSSTFWGALANKAEKLRHGQWTRMQAGMVAPGASLISKDFYTQSKSVALKSGLNVLNLSYGMMGTDGYSTVRWSAQESSIINYAMNGKAVVVKGAGNDGVAVGAANLSGLKDYLNRDLIGGKSVIFAGALSTVGSTSAPASLASYSNFAGDNATVQKRFLVVGVDSSKMGLAGTSFAAPIVSGYAAILGSKFKTATPIQISNQLLNSARTNTILNYSPSLHGQGEACLTCALAPRSIK